MATSPRTDHTRGPHGPATERAGPAAGRGDGKRRSPVMTATCAARRAAIRAGRLVVPGTVTRRTSAPRAVRIAIAGGPPGRPAALGRQQRAVGRPDRGCRSDGAWGHGPPGSARASRRAAPRGSHGHHRQNAWATHAGFPARSSRGSPTAAGKRVVRRRPGNVRAAAARPRRRPRARAPRRPPQLWTACPSNGGRPWVLRYCSPSSRRRRVTRRRLAASSLSSAAISSRRRRTSASWRSSGRATRRGSRGGAPAPGSAWCHSSRSAARDSSASRSSLSSSR